MPKKILITGGTGGIGQELINCLADENVIIRILVRKSRFNLSNKVEFVFGDLLDRDSLLKAVQGVDLVVHLAAVTHANNENLYRLVNVDGTRNLVDAAKKVNVNKFIFVSTRATALSGGAYGQSKLAAEKIVKNSGINWIILKPAEIYGTKKGGMLERLIKLVRKIYIVPIIDNGKYPLSPVYIGDITNILKKVILRDYLVNESYILTGPESFSFSELVEQICRFYKLRRVKVYCPLFLLKFIFKLLSIIPGRSSFVYDQLLRLLSPKSSDISLAQKDLSFKPISFQEGLSLLKRQTKFF